MITHKKILIAILILAAVLRLFRLDYPKTYVFDEVYHGFTAKEFLAGHKEAWEWWTKPPPGVAYEWTHPPLAKEIMAASMFLVRTQDSWAYRLPGSLLGVLSVYLVYLIGIRLLKNESASLISAFIFSMDGLNFVQSRTGMNDIYFVTFMLGSVLFLLKRNYIWSAILVGLSLASKWTGFYLLLMMFILLIKDRQFKKIPYFILIPIGIYLITYLPFFLLGHSFNQFINIPALINCQLTKINVPCLHEFGLQNQMLAYHTSLKATHNYSSPWWSWPFNLYPVWYFVDYQKDKIANILGSGNSAVFWVGSAAIILTLIEVVMKKSSSLFIILLGFFVFWLPWAISPRIMFLYHFSPSVPFLSLGLGYQLLVLKENKNRKLIIILISLMIINFILIFPFLTGIPISKALVNLFFLTNFSKNPFN